jgi:hypothetical protein
MTPQAYKNLQQPFAQTLAGMLGFGTQPAAAPAPTQQYAAGSYPQAGGAQGGGQPNYNTYPYGNTHSGQGRQPPAQAPQAPTQPQTPAFAAPTNTNPNDILSHIPKYQGDLSAPIGANEQDLLTQLMGTGQGSSNYLQQLLSGSFLPGGANASQLPNVSAQGTGYDPSTDPYAAMGLGQQTNPFLQAYTQAQQRTTMDQLTQALTRDLPGRFTAGGQFVQPQGSSAFDRAAALASTGAANAMGDIAANIGYNAYASDRGLQAQAINDQQNRLLQSGTTNAQNDLAAQQSNQSTALAQNTNERNLQQAGVGLDQAQVQTMIANLQAQALPRLIQEQGIDRGIASFNQQMQTLMQTLGITANITQPTVANSSESNTKPNLIPSIGLSA